MKPFLAIIWLLLFFNAVLMQEEASEDGIKKDEIEPDNLTQADLNQNSTVMPLVESIDKLPDDSNVPKEDVGVEEESYVEIVADTGSPTDAPASTSTQATTTGSPPTTSSAYFLLPAPLLITASILIKVSM